MQMLVTLVVVRPLRLRFSVRSLLAAISIVALAICSAMITEGSKHKAVVYVLDWVIEGERIPGIDFDYPDAELMSNVEKIYGNTSAV